MLAVCAETAGVNFPGESPGLEEPYRGGGFARCMLDALFDHVQVQGLRRMMLATRDAHELYAKYGFTPLGAPDRFMEFHRPDVYRAPVA